MVQLIPSESCNVPLLDTFGIAPSHAVMFVWRTPERWLFAYAGMLVSQPGQREQTGPGIPLGLMATAA